mgnify:CR=1 FL=1
MLGPVLGGFLYQAGGYPLPFIVMGVINLVSMPLYLCVLPSPSKSGKLKCMRKCKQHLLTSGHDCGRDMVFMNISALSKDRSCDDDLHFQFLNTPV